MCDCRGIQLDVTNTYLRHHAAACCLQDKFVDQNVDLIFLEYAINDGYTVSAAAVPDACYTCICQLCLPVLAIKKYKGP
jgi:hypothetical protein